jgi:uncharacterized protein YutE (UPF0331/DUF86 family)
MINKILVKQRLTMINDYSFELDNLKQLPKDIFLEKVNSAAAESFLRRSLEAIFDIGRHILAKSGQVELAGEYKSIASGLVKIEAVSSELGETLMEMAGYRNRLVHLYHMVDAEELYYIVHNNTSDLIEFIRQINKFIDQKE